MKSRNLILLVLFALLITPVLAAGPESRFYMVPTDKMVYSMVPYDAMVYQDGTYTIAVNRTGGIINATLISAHQDDVPVQAALNTFTNGGHLSVTSGTYNITTGIIYNNPSSVKITGAGSSTVFNAVAYITMFTFGGHPTSAVEGVYLSDFYVDGNSQANVGIRFENAYNINMDNVNVEYTNKGLIFIEGFPATITNGRINRNVVCGIQVGESSTYAFTKMLVQGTRIEFNGDGVLIGSGTGITFSGTVIEGNEGNGVLIEEFSGATVYGVTFDGVHFEYNDVSRAAAKRDINVLSASESGLILNCLFSGDYVDYYLYLAPGATGWEKYSGSTANRGISDNSGEGSLSSIDEIQVLPGWSNRNLLNYTQQLENAVWAGGGNVGTRTNNVTTAPDWTTTASSVSHTGAWYFGQDLTLTPSAEYTYSIYAKNGTSDSFTMSLYKGSYYLDVAVNLTTDSVVAGAGSSGKVIYVDDGWHRIICHTTAPSSGGATTVYLAGTAGTIYFWGAQVERGTRVSPYEMKQ